jgi:uncharacterized transporter YbjL
MVKRLATTILILLLSATNVMADPEMADTMRSNGKIYVVVAVLATIFAGIFIYLVLIDRKVSRIEKSGK